MIMILFFISLFYNFFMTQIHFSENYCVCVCLASRWECQNHVNILCLFMIMILFFISFFYNLFMTQIHFSENYCVCVWHHGDNLRIMWFWLTHCGTKRRQSQVWNPNLTIWQQFFILSQVRYICLCFVIR
jgi:hypothetical protein